MRFLEGVVALAIREFGPGVPSSNPRTCMYLFMKASRVVLRGVRLREES